MNFGLLENYGVTIVRICQKHQNGQDLTDTETNIRKKYRYRAGSPAHLHSIKSPAIVQSLEVEGVD